MVTLALFLGASLLGSIFLTYEVLLMVLILWNALSGYKTYLIAAGGISLALGQLLTAPDPATFAVALHGLVVALGLATLRHGIATATKP